MRKYITLFFSASLFLFSCKNDKTPDDIIPHDRMVNLMTEVHLIDGRMYSIVISQDSLAKYGTLRYDALFKRYHTDSAQFNKSMKYYVRRPEELQKMYEKILSNLRQKSDSLMKIQRVKDSLQRLELKKQHPA